MVGFDCSCNEANRAEISPPERSETAEFTALFVFLERGRTIDVRPSLRDASSGQRLRSVEQNLFERGVIRRITEVVRRHVVHRDRLVLGV